jgi:hypothetical protein
VSWFWLNRIALYSVFEITSGTVYTHVSVSSVVGLMSCCHLKENIQAIFDTLISRTQLRDRMAATSSSGYVDFRFPSTQVQSYFDSPSVWPN